MKPMDVVDISIRSKEIEQGVLFRYVMLLEEILVIEHQVLNSDMESDEKRDLMGVISLIKNEILEVLHKAREQESLSGLPSNTSAEQQA